MMEQKNARHSEEYVNIQRHLREAIDAGRQVISLERRMAQMPSVENRKKQRHYSIASNAYMPTPPSQCNMVINSNVGVIGLD